VLPAKRGHLSGEQQRPGVLGKVLNIPSRGIPNCDQIEEGAANYSSRPA